MILCKQRITRYDDVVLNEYYSLLLHTTSTEQESIYFCFVASILFVFGTRLNTYERWTSNPKGHIARNCWRLYRVVILMNSQVK